MLASCSRITELALGKPGLLAPAVRSVSTAASVPTTKKAPRRALS